MNENALKAADIFETKVRTANPSFTKTSLRRTAEVCIIEAKCLGPLANISDDDVDELLELTQTSWSGKVREDKIEGLK